MKKIEVAAFLLVVLWVIAVLPPWGFRLFAGRFFGPTEFGALTAGHKAMATADGILAAAVQIGVGAWLFSLARRTKHNPFVWALFGLTYGLLAVILFFVMRIHNSMGISVNDGPCEQHTGQVSSEAAPSAPPDEPSAWAFAEENEDRIHRPDHRADHARS